ncbi:lipid-A-disaccharide synthase [Acetobacteraceae bacterium B3987]|nr:lipid-A-disaccharide synthase [Acetobacteraceae bacterium B3987]
MVGVGAPVEGEVPLHQHGRVIWILAGEPSGDSIGARLMQALHRIDPTLVFAGVGGGRMEARGLRSLFPMEDLTVMGFMEVLPRLRLLSQRLLEAEQDIELRRPDIVITIDSPGFSFRLLKRIRKLNVRRLHYVAPQVWAWRESRVKGYRGLWDRLLCLFPFEEKWFADRGLPEGRFVGHPILQSGVAHGKALRFFKRHNLRPTSPILILMPGSRSSEVPQLLPVFEKTLAILHERFPDLQPVIPATSGMAPLVRKMVKHWTVYPSILTDTEDKHDAIRAANCALTKSGTSILELAIGGVPMVVTYKVNPLSAVLGRLFLRLPYISMINILAGREIVPELVQHDCNPQKLADEITSLLTDETKRQAQCEAFGNILAMLKAPNDELPAMSAAKQVLELMETPLSEIRPS